MRRDYETARLLGFLELDPETTPVVKASVQEPPNEDDNFERSGLMLLGNSWYAVHDRPQDPDELDDDTVLVLGHWRYAGRGHSPAEGLLARTIAQDILDNRRHSRAGHEDRSMGPRVKRPNDSMTAAQRTLQARAAAYRLHSLYDSRELTRAAWAAFNDRVCSTGRSG